MLTFNTATVNSTNWLFLLDFPTFQSLLITNVECWMLTAEIDLISIYLNQDENNSLVLNKRIKKHPDFSPLKKGGRGNRNLTTTYQHEASSLLRYLLLSVCFCCKGDTVYTVGGMVLLRSLSSYILSLLSIFLFLVSWSS